MFNPILTILNTARKIAVEGSKNFSDNSLGGVVRNTITGIPQAAKEMVTGTGQFKANSKLGIARNTVIGLPRAARDVLAPTRGYTEKELLAAKPTLKQKVVAIPKVGAEIVSGLGELATMIPGYSTAVYKATNNRVGDKLVGASQKFNEFGVPKNVEEAKAMRVFDVASNFVPGISSIKNVARSRKVIAASKDVAVIAKELKTMGVADDLVEAYAPRLVNVSSEKEVQAALTNIEKLQATTKATVEATPRKELRQDFRANLEYNVSNELSKLKPDQMLNPDGTINLRLSELQDQVSKGKLSFEENSDAIRLLRERGIETVPEPTQQMREYADIVQRNTPANKRTPIQDIQTGRLQGSRSVEGIINPKGIDDYEAFMRYKPLTSGPKYSNEIVEKFIRDTATESGFKGNLKVIFDENIIRDTGNLGMAKSYIDVISGETKHVISIYTSNGKSPVRVGGHELRHVLDNTIGDESLNALRREAALKMEARDFQFYKNKGYETRYQQVDEFMADEWGKKMADKAGYKSRIQKVVDAINAAVEKIVSVAKRVYEHVKNIPNKKGGFARFRSEGSNAPQPRSDGFDISSKGSYKNILPENRTRIQPVQGGVDGIRPVSNVENGGATRGFINSVREQIPQASKVAGQYIPRSTDELAIKAKNLIKDDVARAERIAMTQSNDAAVAIASELLKKYSDDAANAVDQAVANALYDKAAEIANALAPKLTEAGRSIQAASILARLTPEGQLRFAAREIQRYNGANPLKKIPELSGEQSKFILDEMKAIQNMPDGVERAIRFKNLQDFISNLIPTGIMKKVITVWKAGLLTGLKTSGVNIFSNLSHTASEVVKDAPATIVDSVASLFTGKRTKTFNVSGLKGGLKEGFEKGIRYFKTGYDPRNIAEKFDYTKVNFGKSKAGKAFQTYTDTVFRAMGTADQPFYYGALSRSLADQALAQGKNQGLKGKALKDFAENLVQNPTEEMLRYGVTDATTAVFQNKTNLGEIASKIQQLPSGVGEIILPFGRTPSAVAMQIINYSPVGIAKTIIENIGRGKFDQRLFSQGLGRSLTGTAVLGIGYLLAKQDRVSLDYPTTEREQKLWEAEGRKPNSIKIGDKWRSIQVLGPAGNVLLIGSHYNDELKKTGSPTEAISKAILGSAKSFTDNTFLTGLKDAINALTDPERYAKSYLPNLVASIVPTLVSDVARATDSKERRAENLFERVGSRVPGARNRLEPQIDIIGRERESVGNPLEIILDPTRPSKDIATPTVKELRRLTDAGFKVSPTLLGDKKGYPVLTQEENTGLWKMTGEIIDDKLTKLFRNEAYLNLPDDEKAKTVENFIEKAQISARAAAVLEKTDGLLGEELKAKLAELKAGKLLTRDVYKLYEELR